MNIIISNKLLIYLTHEAKPFIIVIIRCIVLVALEAKSTDDGG